MHNNPLVLASAQYNLLVSLTFTDSRSNPGERLLCHWSCPGADNEVCPDLVRPTRLTGTWAEWCCIAGGPQVSCCWSMRQVRGTDSARQPTVNELTHCSHEQTAAATVRLIRLHLKSYAKLQTSNCLTKLNLIPTTFSTLYYHRHL